MVKPTIIKNRTKAEISHCNIGLHVEPIDKMNINFKRRTMSKLSNNCFLSIFAVVFLSACDNLTNKVENKLDELENKTMSLDSLINKEVDRVLTFDSLINGGSDKVKKLDSLIDKKTSKLDSISNEKLKLFEKNN
ncbi:MAG TPA: hypothetical protein VFM79_00295 [Pelobium sp.]|nr:hypothetical protein [Pelobium sp.]